MPQILSKIQLDFKMSEMIDPFISQTYVPNYFIPGLRWTAMTCVTYHSAQQTWEGRRKKHAKDKPLVRDFRFLEDHLPTWRFVHGKQNINEKERNFFPIIFGMFFSVFPPRPSHVTPSHPSRWLALITWLSGSFPLFSLSKHRWFWAPPPVSAHPFIRKSEIVDPLFHLCPEDWLPAGSQLSFLTPFLSQLTTGFLISPWIYEACSLLVCLPLLGPSSERGVLQVWRFRPSPRTSFT